MSSDTPDQPPPYDDDPSNDVNKTLEPAILLLAAQSIHAESATSASLYQLNRGVADLTYATSEVEFSRVDRSVRTNSSDEPTVRPRVRHIYDLKHQKGILGTLSSLPSDSPAFFIEAMSRKTLGCMGLKKSALRSQWRALPVDITGKASKYNFPAFVKDAKPLFEIREKKGRYEWSDSEGNAIAVEDDGEGQRRLLVTASLQRDTMDALVALWCCRLWQYNAEHQEPLYSGMDGVRRKFALAKEMGNGKGGIYG
ncbi:uncharacterized protein DNG_04441 [Cephalotrichum gorgonifer]|uniref:Uncharacterized protein n=1 Tax=Cephalotrichum gorgonifer TaxID=2041049 RepID=A0AAE8SUJ5_9PEZI|nr:uncharacterized protein DNG_04441 [Cephalotrichum gorgonifer]